MLKRKLYAVNLGLFGEGDGSGGTAQTGAEGQDAAVKDNNSGDVVLYGKQPTEVKAENKTEKKQDAAADNGKADRKAEFEKLIKGEYKEDYDKSVQQIIKQRFKQTKQTEEALKGYEALSDMLAQRYGIETRNPAELIKAIENDDGYWESEAEREGISVSQLKRMRALERQNSAFEEARRAQQAQEQANQTYARWTQQAEQLKTVYPDFDLAAESQNRQFVELLQYNVDMKTAYEVAHHDEIVQRAAAQSAKAAAEKTTQSIAARGTRPAENGLSGQAGVVVKSDVNKLTGDDINEILKRVARGEKITF